MGRWTGHRRIAMLGLLLGLSVVLMGCDADEVSRMLRSAVAVDQAPPADATRQRDRAAARDKKATGQRDRAAARDKKATRQRRPARTNTSADDTGASTGVAAIEQKIADLLNTARRKDGRSTLTVRRGISTGARDWACGMAQSGNFRHADLRSAGVSGENIAWGQRSASDVHHAWMHSAGHRRNRMNPRWSEYGVGVCRDGAGTLYFTERFR